MRNLKRVLALAMAMVMVLGMMVIGSSAASYTDETAINPDYAVAVEVLSDMGVFKGTGAGFAPKQTLSRAEAATLIYRVITADVEDAKISLYDYSSFDDVAEGEWYTSYVTYAANGGYIKGDGTGNFLPAAKVTGIQVLAIMLRAMGYGQKGEFEGAAWKDNVLTTADDLGILNNVAEDDLDKAASRELVAQLLWDAIQAPTTTYTPAFGYYPSTNASLGVKKFGLAAATMEDEWYRPYTGWTYTTGAKATWFLNEHLTYTTAVTECQVATDAKIKSTKTYDLYVNGVKSSDTIYALDTVDTIGAQGRLTEVYADRIVMIDTLLAKVEDVAAATYDAAGHLKSPSKIVLNVYDADTDPATACTDDYVLTNGATNYEYAKGDMVLVNAYTVSGDRDTAGAVSKAWNNMGTYAEILGVATSITGAQTVIWYNIGKHTVNGTTYTDAAEFHLDEAQEATTNHTWYFDQYGNVIGNVEVATQYDYAVIKNIWWAGDNTTGAGKALATLVYMDGTENVVTVNSIDNCAPAYSTIWSDVMKFDATNKVVKVATDAATNAVRDNVTGTGYGDVIHGHLFKVGTLANGAVALTEVTAELSTNVSIINKYAYITSAQANVAIDTDTQFLVRTGTETPGFKYTTYTGLNEIPSFKSVVAVDYVLGAGNVADYVYIIGEPIDATSKDFILITDDAYSAVLKTLGDVNYWEITLPVPAEDGSYVTVKTHVEAVKNALTNITSVGKLFYVEYTNGYIDTMPVETTNTVKSYGMADGRYVALYDATMSGGVVTAKVNTNVTVRFNITEATTVVGELAANMTDKTVYVIYDAKNLVAAKVYVLDEYYEINPAGAPTVVNMNVAATGKVAKNTKIADIEFAATIVASSDLNCNGALETSVQWYKYNAAGVPEAVPADAVIFTTGVYYAEITITVDNADGEYYVLDKAPTVTFTGLTDATYDKGVVTTRDYVIG